MRTVVVTASKLPATTELNQQLGIIWSGRYILDALFLSVRGNSQALLILADAQSLDVIDYEIAAAENYETWRHFLLRISPVIINSGIEKFFVSDGKKGLHQALKELFPGVPRQLCQTHKHRRVNQILPQIRGDELDWAFGHLAHQAIKADSERGYWVYFKLLQEFLKPSFYERLSEPHQYKLKRVIGTLRYQRQELQTHLRHPELIGQDKTTNILEGINSFFKERLDLMKGLKTESHVEPMIKLLVYYYRFHAFTASGVRGRNGRRPVGLNQRLNREKLQQLIKGKRPYSWIHNFITGT